MSGGGSSDGRSPRIDLVPIIDAMTCVIFFLLLSSTFIEFTKITLPPAISVVTQSSIDKAPPMSPKLVGILKGNSIQLVLSWSGPVPGHISKTVERQIDNKISEALLSSTFELMEEFKSKYPNEQNVQVGFSQKVTYQEMISTMDGARKIFPDLAMISWTEAESVANLIKE